jgi:ubiquinone/menaquinone biosynthesis C-methylase UbiE/uncharacterized protein YbaR (Trm112 family)
MAVMNIADAIRKGHICCPVCRHMDFGIGTETNDENTLLHCLSCNKQYRVVDGIPVFVIQENEDGRAKKDIQRFWSQLYKRVYAENDLSTIQNELTQHVSELERLFCHRRHLAVTEMPIRELRGKRVLEIGSGAGAHSAFIAYKGADMFSIDITTERVVATSKKLDLIGSGENIALQADAEYLPFPDDHFDIVYSNGVLHHTPRTEQAVSEVYRVLKSGGSAVIMLYARDSFLYWVNLFFLKGVLLGNIFRSKDWLGKTTEWMSDEKQNVYNPETKVYSTGGIARLFAKFDSVKIRKNSFTFDQIPMLGRHLSKYLGKFAGYNEAGKLVYGRPWRNETRVELWLGRYIGFGINISAKK